MPVGFCLGEMSPSVGNADDHGGLAASSNGAGLDVIVTSSVLNTADQFAFMQQTLLMQIFRAPAVTTAPSPPPTTAGTAINGCGNAANGAWNGKADGRIVVYISDLSIERVRMTEWLLSNG